MIIAERMRLDAARVAREIASTLCSRVGQELRRSGIVVGMSGGVDSSVCAALAVRAMGARRVLGLAMPERESQIESLELAKEWAADLGIQLMVEDVTATLEACGCYARRDAAVRRFLPYGKGWRCKLALDTGGLDTDRLPLAYLVAESPSGDVRRVRLPAREVREIIAATNFKQRARKMVEYYHADRLRYAVLGTPNRLEYELGFFVKGGDGLADVKPIAHLYKSQVYQLAEYLGVPRAIRERTPTTDTYSLPQSQEELFFSLPVADLDVVLEAYNRGRDPAAVGLELDLEPDQVVRAFRDIGRKRQAARYLHGALFVHPSMAVAD
jgi:NAD+ synthase